MKMKKSILFVMSILLFSILTFAGDPPAAVQNAFEQKFPGAEKLKWNKENTLEYEASFKWNGAKYSASFKNTGEWLETERELAFNQLPDKVKKAFNTTHVVGTAKGGSKIETSKRITKFEVEFKQGYKTFEIFYNEEGTEIKGE